MSKLPDFYNMIAHERGAPSDWHWFELRGVGERPNHAFLVRGGVAPLLTRGKNKGHHNWRLLDKSTVREFVVTPADLEARTLKWEQETGSCHRCGGDGQELASCGIRGNTYRDCSRCKATGKVAA